MNKAYSRTYWQNKPSTETPIDADNLNNIEAGVDTIDDRVVALDASQSGLSDRVTTAEGNIISLQNGKVDKVSGKGLSTNDYTTADKTKLAGISAQANRTTVTQVQESGDTSKEIAQIGLDGETTSIYADDAKKVIESCYEEKTVTGNPITIKTISGSNAKALTVSMNPIQDLHGYDYPWVGGAGKNKLDDSTVSSLNNVTYQNGVVTEIEADSRNSALFVLQAYNNETYVRNLGTSYGSIKQLPFTKDSTFNKISFGNSGTTKDAKLRFDVSNLSDGEYKWCFTSENYTTHPFSWKDMMIVESSVTDYSYETYSNICPISGRTEASVTRTGKNLFGGDALIDDYLNLPYLIVTKISDESMSYSTYGQSTIAKIYDFDGKPNTRYTFIASPSNSYTGQLPLVLLYSDGTNAWCNAFSNGVSVTTSAANKTLIGLGFRQSTSTTYINQKLSGLFEGVLTADDLEPYQGETHTHQYGQTVYGGEDDFVNGEVTSEFGFAEYDGSSDENWSTYAWSTYKGFAIGITDMGNQNNADGLANWLKCRANYSEMGIRLGANNNSAYILHIGDNIEGVTDVETWKTYLANNPLQIVFPLATPTTIETSAEDISLLKGNNVVSTDGDDMELFYQELPDITSLVQYVQTLEARIKALEEAE